MEITIKAQPEEIATLVLAVQARQCGNESKVQNSSPERVGTKEGSGKRRYGGVYDRHTGVMAEWANSESEPEKT